MSRFLAVAQWQGSPSTRAMSLADGTEAIVGDLPRAAVITVDVPLEAGESIDTGVHRASSLARVQESLRDALTSHADPVVVIGGDCSVSVAAVEHVAGDDLAVIWFDAHPDLHTPETSESGAFSGMALRAVMGEGAPTLVSRTPVTAERVVLVGTRNHDDAEAEHLSRETALTLIAASALADPAGLVDAVVATGASRVYIHVDLDVLDPAEISGVADAAPFGATRADVVAAIRAVRERLPLAGATIAGFAPTTPLAAVDDLGAILRIVGALA